MKIDLSNAASLDSGIIEKFSNFRFLGVGKPSDKQIDKWETKGKTGKIDSLVQKGKIDPSKLDKYKTSVVGSSTTPADAATTDASKLTDATITKDATPPTDNSDKILGMSKPVAIVVGLVALTAFGFIIFKVTKGRGSAVATA
jgi:hypothetical protein